MSTHAEALQHLVTVVVDDFYRELASLPRARRILEMLSPDEMQHLKARQADNLAMLAGPFPAGGEPEAMARHLGRIHAIVGVDRDELASSRGLILASMRVHAEGVLDNEALSAFGQRLNRDLAWQLQSYEAIEKSRQEVLLRVTRATWNPGTYIDLINSVVASLSQHEEIACCAIGRPDGQGVFHFEAATAGETIPYFTELLGPNGIRVVTHADQPGGQGPVGRAWRSGQIERVINFSTHAYAALWRDIAIQNGFRSCAAVPLGVPGEQPLAILLVHSNLPGGFIGLQQSAFLEMLQVLLGYAFARLGEIDGIRAAIPFTARDRLAALVRTDALHTHYQPILDLRSGRVVKVEGLARLQEGEKLLSPAEFIDILEGDDLLEVFSRCLNQALADRNAWLQAGIELEMSINLPPAALGDIRYYDATCAALARHACPAGCLTLEVLENQVVSLTDGRYALLENFLALGVKLAQDDLGAGHSGLSRLRGLPFDWIKIDRSMSQFDAGDPVPALRFIYYLTRLGHALGKQVVAEGIETADWLAAFAILGVDAGQGYVIAKPMAAAALPGWLQQRCVTQPAVPPLGTLSRLAILLVWAERLLSDCYVFPWHDAAESDETAARNVIDETVRLSLPMLHGVESRTPEEALARQQIIEAAQTFGPYSEAFMRARRHLADVILAGPEG